MWLDLAYVLGKLDIYWALKDGMYGRVHRAVEAMN